MDLDEETHGVGMHADQERPLERTLWRFARLNGAIAVELASGR